jgi:hypothetical protein
VEGPGLKISGWGLKIFTDFYLIFNSSSKQIPDQITSICIPSSPSVTINLPFNAIKTMTNESTITQTTSKELK